MSAWKLGAVAAVTAFLAVTPTHADDAAAAILAAASKAEAAAAEAKNEPTVDVSIRRSEYWIGVLASRPSPALQAQLKLPKDQGLVVEPLLQPGCPAAKAGLQRYDVLLKGNDKPLADPSDLVRLINQVKDGKLTLDLLRAGKHETVTVAPRRRPADDPDDEGGLWIPEDEAVRGLIQKVAPNFTAGQPLEFRIIRPGQILPPGDPMAGLARSGSGSATIEVTVHTKADLADGSKVEITQQGAEPAKVVVTHDKDKWEGTSGDLSKFPEKIRPEMERLLHPAFDHKRFFLRTGEGSMTLSGSAVMPPGLPGQFAVPPDIEKRLSDMQKQVDELRRSVDALQRATGKPIPKPE